MEKLDDIDNQKKILVIDDSPTLLKGINDIIKKHLDVKVFLAESARVAMRILGNHNIDIILMDVNMPEIDGFKAAFIFKQQKKTADIPIIFITAYDDEGLLKEKVFAAGGVDYIPKTFKEMELIRLLTLYFRFIDHERNVNLAIRDTNIKLYDEILARKKVEKALLKSENELKETIAMKDKFFSIIAHDLKNPLGAFKALTKLMNEEFDSFATDEFKEMIMEMNKSSDHIYNLLDNLLQWAGTQLGKVECNPENINLDFLVKQNIELMQLSADKKSITLIRDTPKNLEAFADMNMTTTVIRNILSNAIKFTPDKGNIRISAITDNEGLITVTIADSGIGIAQDGIDKLFRIDVQHTTLGTNDEKGTGLGLILCKEFVEENGGKIWVESEHGKGSQFKFTLKPSVIEIDLLSI